MKKIQSLPTGIQRLLFVLSIIFTLIVIISLDGFESFIEGILSPGVLVIVPTMAVIWIVYWLIILLILWIIEGFNK